jgi:hypothetical protein
MHKVITADSKSKLRKQRDKLLKDNWKPQCGIKLSVDNHGKSYFCQTMIKF